MGDCGQVGIRTKLGTVYLYTHWGGSELIGDVRKAIARNLRWDDDEYLARIVFDAMKGDDIKAETGFGIGLSVHGDIGHPIIVLSVDEQEVVAMDSSGKTELGRCSFDEFAKGGLKEIEYEDD